MRWISVAAALGLVSTAPLSSRAADCSMTAYSQCAGTPARKDECVAILYGIREACNGKADGAQAKMQELGSTTSPDAKPEMASYLVALNVLFDISRTAQVLSYTDPKALELLKDVNVDTGEQQYRMNRTFEIVAQKEKEALKNTAAGGGKTAAPSTKTPANPPRSRSNARTAPRSSGNADAAATNGSGDGGEPAGGGAAANSGEDDAGQTADAAAAERARAGGDKALSRARGLGDALKNGMNTDDGGGPAGKAAGLLAGGAGRPGSAASPKSEKDLLLASVSGYGGSLTALGLHAGKDASGAPVILRADGSPAGAAELAALKARIGGEPEALMRRPDFYSAIPRQRFMELKDDYRSRPELRDGPFRDVGLTASERDFQRSASCSTLSGPCAPYAKASSYKKGDGVPPEELASIHRAVHDEPESEFFDEGPDGGPEGGEKAAFPGPPEDPDTAAPAAPRSALRAAIATLENLIATPSGETPDAETGGAPGPAARHAPGRAVPLVERARTAAASRNLLLPAAGALLLALALLRRRST